MNQNKTKIKCILTKRFVTNIPAPLKAETADCL